MTGAPAGPTDLHASAVSVLAGWAAPDRDQDDLRRTYLEHLLAHDDGMWRTCVPAHLTASLLVLDPDGSHVLLAHHRKGGFWGQFGGHCETGDVSLAAAALREGVEESGLGGLRLVGDGPVDLDRHALSGAFGACGEHLDVRFAAVVAAGARPVVSDESEDVRWFGVEDLPGSAVVDLGRLVERSRAALRGSRIGQSTTS